MRTIDEITQPFIENFEAPDPVAKPGLKFTNKIMKGNWEIIHRDIGAGYFWGSFLYLFGKDLDKLKPCLKEWSFLMKDASDDQVIIGRNAYGAILIMEDANKPSNYLSILDPLNVTYTVNRECAFTNVIADYLPQRLLPGFLDFSVYAEWLDKYRTMLEPDEILAIIVPLSLGGKMELSNFQVENIFEYYKSTGPIYKKAINKAKK